VLVFVTGACTQDEFSALLTVSVQKGRSFLCKHGGVGEHQDLVAGEFLHGHVLRQAHEVHRDVGRLGRFEPGGFTPAGQGAVPGVVFAVPLVAILLQKRA